ncbi:MAG: hypothetical protein J6Y07_04020 [Alphaproteobacteria bacterium]|nr:hypothetical protein [Alphaproteobacteria bacterium]
MKKKIVYISGADSFNAAQVRAAFDEVRSTLGLDSDTVLFGVPVDDLIAVENTTIADDSVNVDVTEDVSESTKNSERNESVESHVVPILSVLGGENEDAAPVEEMVISDKITESIEIQDTADIDKILQDEAPVENHEKTLEELLETMTPLREDSHPEDSVAEMPESPVKEDALDDSDATLANLASEFVDVQDKVPTFKKSSERGKISKLKNILPFKKMKRDDTGIMGDLFGWAGVAANDEDFSIPGFFTNVASKK